MRIALLVLWVASCFAPLVMAEDLDSVRLAQFSNYMVKVEYRLQHSNGQEPTAPGWVERCESCGRYHKNSASDALREERGVQMPGIAISPTQVVLKDPQIQSRFVKEIEIQQGSDRIAAEVAAWCTDHSALLLTLKRPLAIEPIEFTSASNAGKYHALTYRERAGEWVLRSSPWSSSPALRDDGKTVLFGPAPSLIVDEAARPVALLMDEDLPGDLAWARSPEQWNWIPAADAEQSLKQFEAKLDAAILRVALNFRSPAGGNRSMQHRYGGNNEQEDNAAETWALGVLISPNRVLILRELKPTLTARLERIRIFRSDNTVANAKFLCSLEEYGALIAELEQPLDGAVAVSEKPIQQLRHQLLWSANISINGDKRTCWTGHNRVDTLEPGRRGLLKPQDNVGDDLFAFDAEGRLVLMPISYRQQASQRWEREKKTITAAVSLREIWADPSRLADSGNVPLDESQENRLAWLGVELQPMTPELAKAHKVADQLRDSYGTGGLVTHIYPDSPAAKAGVEVGYVLLRLHVPGQTQPIEVETGHDDVLDMQFPWDRLDAVPAEYMEQIPQPWPSVNNTLNQTLTNIGFGRTVKAEFAREGQPIFIEFTIQRGPEHFDSAPKYKSESLGITVRELTYETRRFYRRPEGEPGVLLAKVIGGSKAAIAGLRPYEIITHVNDTPVASVQEFEKLLSGQKEMRFSVKRMARGRVVKILADAPAATQPAVTLP